MSQPEEKKTSDTSQGISNRESAAEEERERQEHPPLVERLPASEDVTAEADERSSADTAVEQTSGKRGSRSTAQKEAEARHSERPVPASNPVDGAFGKEPA